MCVLCVDTTFHNQADVMCVESEPFKLQHRGEGSLAGNNALAHYEYSHSYNQISHALSNIHGLYRCSCNLHDVKSVYSLNSVTYQAVSPTNNLGMWLKLTRNIFFLLCLSPLNMSLFPAEPRKLTPHMCYIL